MSRSRALLSLVFAGSLLLPAAASAGAFAQVWTLSGWDYVQNLGNTDYVTYYSDTQGPTDNARFYTGRGRNVTLSWQAGF